MNFVLYFSKNYNLNEIKRDSSDEHILTEILKYFHTQKHNNNLHIVEYS